MSMSENFPLNGTVLEELGLLPQPLDREGGDPVDWTKLQDFAHRKIQSGEDRREVSDRILTFRKWREAYVAMLLKRLCSDDE